ncbi:hypothetical protein MPTK1_2g22330 [Marchantia polymorpha subsp. ruderalis]|uniref:ENTH domain-containing protein n=1 Tax=Marchantia polymorpha TaxID=3197 RepID=A0A2R6WND7_MARPO|nr:hypothetical protein MARPO_0072s0094 [Marchantia polymorpha]BBN03291.1 hypothetical protein Mp_2g22330 [Marchantia polymorpha subsp. ruderalis]|eukprot:PTQ35357.1 hypothetical protein MARPO_0072s0094 [Marchantia polymorpha]
MAGGSTQQNIRKALGAIKDSTKVGLAKVNSDYKDLDIAVVKATNHVECPPKEKHVRTIFAATSVARPRADVAYCIHALARRIAKTHNWTVALKAMMVIHRTLREGDPTFREELIQYSRSKGHILNLSNFKDDSSPNAWDYSAWVRTYALFLEERLECFRVLKYDVESEKSSGHSKTRELDTVELLEHLPALQQLLQRLMGCQPEGAAVSNYCIQAALGLVLKESFKLYRAINDGIINLVDKFFEMQRHDAIKALDIYKKAGQQAERLSEFYEVCKSLELARSFQFPTLEQPPQSFLSTMEQYVKDAPRVSNVPKEIEYYDERGGAGRLRIAASPSSPPEYKDDPDYQDASPRAAPAPPPPEEAPPPPPPSAPPQMETDLLGLGDMLPDANHLEEQNALALAIVPQSASANGGTHDANGGVDLSSGATGWELALVTTPTTGNGTTTASDPNQKLAGGLDKLLLDSLYDDAMTRRPNSYGQAPNSYNSLPAGAPNPFDTGVAPQDPFMASRGVAPPPNVQMAHMMQQQMMMQQPPHMMGGQPPNPFGTPFGAAPIAPQFPGALPPGTPPNQMVPYGAPAPQFTNNPFGNPGYL